VGGTPQRAITTSDGDIQTKQKKKRKKKKGEQDN
jgi:hypothetical protein